MDYNRRSLVSPTLEHDIPRFCRLVALGRHYAYLAGLFQTSNNLK